MSPVVLSAQLFTLGCVAFLATGTLVSAALVRAVRARLSCWEPRSRHRVLVLLAALPVLTASVLLLSATLPSLAALIVPALDHCAVHDDGHAHLCFIHLPERGIHAALLLGLVFVVSYFALRAGLAAARVVRAVKVLDVLARTGEARHDLGVTVIETSHPVCLAGGLFRPRVLMSRGLLDSLSDDERTVVLAHERAHVRRRDALVAGIVRALAVFHLPAVARWLVSELEVAAEQACDEEAAECVGNRVAVASTILTVERAAQDASTNQLGLVAVSFGQRGVARRVEPLLAEPAPPRSLRAPAAWVGVATVGVLVLADELHHLTESLLSFIAH